MALLSYLNIGVGIFMVKKYNKPNLNCIFYNFYFIDFSNFILY